MPSSAVAELSSLWIRGIDSLVRQLEHRVHGSADRSSLAGRYPPRRDAGRLWVSDLDRSVEVGLVLNSRGSWLG
jgi:hypothetical protein